MRPLLAAVACVLAGLVAGGIWTWIQGDRYRADARVLIRPASARIVPAVEALAESSLVGSNVAQTLRLSSPPRISARRGEGGVVTVSVEAESRERARQIDAEAVVILTQKVAQRFGTARVAATVLDPAHAAEQTSPTPTRNFLVAGLAGLAAALAAWLALRTTSAAGAGDAGVERRLRKRIDEVARRERALARRAGELAAWEQQLEGRAGELTVSATPMAEEEPTPAPSPAEAAEPMRAAVAATQSGGWNLHTLERLVGEQGQANPADVEQWSTYLFFLREHADPDGSLPASFDALIADIFGTVPGLTRADWS